jgi:hypothetical protein
MFSRKSKEQSNFSEFIEQKTRLFHSKVVYALNREHEHYYSKNEVLNRSIDPRCKVCGMLLSEFRTTKRFEKLKGPIEFNEDRMAG